MKLLITVPYFYPRVGGVENYTYNVVRGLLRHGWEVSVITTNTEQKKYKKELLWGATIHRLPMLTKISNTPVHPLWYFWIKKIIENEKPDVINVHAPVPYIAEIGALTAGKVPVVVTYHSGTIKKPKSRFNWLLGLYESYILPRLLTRAAAIITFSPEFIQQVAPRVRDKIVELPPGVDEHTFLPKKRPTTTDILYVGRIARNSDWKGLPYLFDALKLVQKKYPKVSLRLVGEGDRIAYYQEYAKANNILNISYAGKKIGEDLAREYQQTRMFILPSISDAESCGIVLLEAMASQKPVIGCLVGGVPKVIKHEKNGLLVPPQDSIALACAIEEILENPEKANAMGQTGLLYAKAHYYWGSIIEKQKKVFERVATP